ncbi:hypothetical protein QE152_g3435 [Popillia japonica]|uniref:Uncharacterized protein n=1 Tax=Popillia japonica TaxID=7064 RepID=A0AAW1N438_POPJA
MAKRERCSKRQIEAMINFIEQHKELIHPGEFPEWEQLKTELNNMEGPTRHVNTEYHSPLFGLLKFNSLLIFNKMLRE